MISKIVYYNGSALVERFIECSDQPYFGFVHFNVGYPVLEPMTLRGSILLFLKRRFLDDNERHILFASPADIGGLEFGHIDVHLNDTDIKMLKLSGSSFRSLIEHVEMSESAETIVHHRPLRNATELLRWFPQGIAELVAYHRDRHMRIYEFRLSARFIASIGHILLIVVPNTMESFWRVWKSKGVPVVLYNPRHGMDDAIRKARHVLGDRVL